MDERLLQVTRHGVTRVPAELWLGLAILARYWVLMIVILVSSRREGSAVLLLGDHGVAWLLLFLQSPVIALLAAAGNRRPDAAAPLRWLWRHGRAIIWLTAAFNIAWTASILWHADYWSWWPEYLLLGCAAFDLFIANMVAQPFYKGLFAEFPDNGQSNDPSRRSNPGA